MKWYYSDAGQQIGPIDDAAFQALVNRGVIRDDTQVWREGMAGLYGAVLAEGTIHAGDPVEVFD